MPPKRARHELGDDEADSIDSNTIKQLYRRIQLLEGNERELRARVQRLEDANAGAMEHSRDLAALASSSRNGGANEDGDEGEADDEGEIERAVVDAYTQDVGGPMVGVVPNLDAPGPSTIPNMPPIFPGVPPHIQANIDNGFSGRNMSPSNSNLVLIDSKEKVKKNPITGKKIIAKAAKELGKAIRTLMLTELGISEGDPLPTRPSFAGLSQNDIQGGEEIPVQPGQEGMPPPETVYIEPTHPGGRPLARPDWSRRLTSRASSRWVEHIAITVLNHSLDAYRLLPIAQHTDPPKGFVPLPDLTRDKCIKTAKTAFLNYCERWRAQTDPEHRDRKDKTVKRKRRGSRKDQKQRDRLSCFEQSTYAKLPNAKEYQAALTIEAMSSEYSTDGEDGEGPISEEWRAGAEKARGGVEGAKALEVKKLGWRSDQMNVFLGDLDSLSRTRAASANKTQHVAQAHPRFSLANPRPSDPPLDGTVFEWMVTPEWRGKEGAVFRGPLE